MKSKPADIPYCGVDVEKIKNAKPKFNLENLRLQNEWIFDRHRTKKVKDSGVCRPWTSNVILQEYKFCNIRREDDRESQYLIQNISENPDMSLENKFYNTLFMRMYNKWSTIVKLGGPRDWGTPPDIDYYNTIITSESERDPSYVWFTNAYNMGGMKRAAGSNFILTRLTDDELAGVDMNDIPSYEGAESIKNKSFPDVFYVPSYLAEKVASLDSDLRVIELKDTNIPIRIVKRVAQLKKEKLFERVISCESQKDVFDLLSNVKGYGKFLAYQLFVDMTYIPEFKFSENEFVVAGPGCERGLHLVWEDFDGLNYAEMLFWLRENIQTVWKDAGLEYDLETLLDDKEVSDRFLSVMSLQNIHCETTRYIRTAKGTGRPKVKYRPFDESSVSDLSSFL